MSLGSRLKSLFAEADAPHEYPIADLTRLVTAQERASRRAAAAATLLRSDRHRRDLARVAETDEVAAREVRALLGRLGGTAPAPVTKTDLETGSTFDWLVLMALEEGKLADDFRLLSSREEDASIRGVLSRAADTHRTNNTEVDLVATMITSFAR